MEKKDKQTVPEDQGPAQTPYVPASPTKRILAWTGVAYMVILVLLNLYPFFHNGAYLQGIAPLVACPGAAGLGIVAVCRRREASARGTRLALGLLAAACLAVFLLGLIDGLPALIAALGLV